LSTRSKKFLKIPPTARYATGSFYLLLDSRL
jgi:hypothetical protein